MDHMKRKLSFNQSSEENTKKLRNEMNQLITSMENLSNELFCEIFDYLDGLDIHIAFSNLNNRFQQLVTSSSVRFKINLDNKTSEEIFLTNYNQIKQQIYSINFQLPKTINELLPSFTINSSFNRLESIVIEDILPDKFISFLSHLADLPRLFSLNIKTIHTIEDLHDIYQLIFALPTLKYNKLYLYGNEYSISIPMADNKQMSTIEYLDIAHGYTFDELSALISYTPQLRRLNLSHAPNQDDSSIETMLPMTLENLTYLSMYTNNMNFDEFEIFIDNIDSKLKVLHITFSHTDDITFLHANRWEQLISRYFPQLKKFSLQYREAGYRDEYPIYSEGQNQFISSFWIQRKWLLEVDTYEYSIHYYVRPYRNRWYDHINSSIEHLKSTQLNIKYTFPNEPPDILLTYVKRVLCIAQIYHLDIQQEISIDRLMQIIHLLPDLVTLKMNSLSFYRSMMLFDQGFPTTCSIEHARNIKNFYIENTEKIEEIDFLISIFPHMEYLSVECIKDMNIELFIRDILNKIDNNHHEHLRLLCIYDVKADEEMIKRLKKMIDDEKLLLNYTIHRKLYNIYLQWK